MEPRLGFYCQEDGGQWNVPVEILDEHVAGFFVICGETLMSLCTINGKGYLCATYAEVHATRQEDNVIPLRA
jgi:hypothetical protein